MQKEEMRSGRKEDKMFVGEGGVEALHWKIGAQIYQIEQWTIQPGEAQRRNDSVGCCGTPGEAWAQQGK